MFQIISFLIMSFNEDPDGKKVFKLNFDFPTLSDTAMFSYLKF